MSQPGRWYFAYGSNMQAATLRGRRRIEPLDVRIGRLAGYRLRFDIPVGSGARGVANICPSENEHVWGVAYLLAEAQHQHLDRTEGVPNGLYRRVPVEVITSAGPLAAETLVSEMRDAARLPSYRYLSLLLEGAREHGLPAEWLAVLEAWDLAWDEREGATNPDHLLPPRPRSPREPRS